MDAIRRQTGVRLDVLKGERLWQLAANPAAAEAKKRSNGMGNEAKKA